MKTKLFSLVFFFSTNFLFAQLKIETFDVKHKNIWEILEDDHGNIWFHPGNLQAYNADIVKYDGKEFLVSKKVGKHNALVVYSMSKDKYKNVWFSGPSSLGKFDGTDTRIFTKKDGLPSNNVAYVYSAQDGATWISTGKAFPIKTGNIGKIVNDEYVPVTNSPIKNNVSYIFTDSKGNMWFGCRGEGFYKYDGNEWTNYTNETTLQWITYITEDQEGNIWLAALEGYFAKFDGNKFSEYRLGDIFLANTGGGSWIVAFFKVDAGSLPKIVVNDNNDVWILIRKRGIMVYKDNKVKSLEETYGMPFDSPKTIHDIIKDSKGNIWICNYANGYLAKHDGQNWTTYNKEDGIPKGPYALFEDSNGNIWVSGKSQISKITFD